MLPHKSNYNDSNNDRFISDIRSTAKLFHHNEYDCAAAASAAFAAANACRSSKRAFKLKFQLTFTFQSES